MEGIQETPQEVQVETVVGLSEVFIYGTAGTTFFLCCLSCCGALYKLYKERRERKDEEEYFNL